MNTLFTRSRAEAWREANPTPAPTQLQAFLAADPRPLPGLPTQYAVTAAALKVALYLLGAVGLGILGWLL